jgi:hypothetical protein
MRISSHHIKFLPLLLLVLLAFLPREAAAETYYVSQTGNDADSGTIQRPWSTLQHAADRLAPGETVIVLSGTYAGFNMFRSGSPGHPITFSARPGVLVNTAAVGTHRSRINIENASYIVIEGFEVVGTNNQTNSKEGIRITGPQDGSAGHITIRRNHIHHNGDRNILTGFVSYLVIEDNIADHAAEEHGIYVSNSADTHVIRGNLVYSNARSGIQINADGSDGGDGVITDAVIENNIIYDNGNGSIVDFGNGPVVASGGGSAINLDGVQRSIIQNNLLYDNHASGISLYQIDGSEPSYDNLVVNNIIINADNGRWALNVQNGSSRNTARGNILSSSNPLGGAINIDSPSLVDFDSDDNVVESYFAIDDVVIDLPGWRSRTGNDEHSVAVTWSGLESLLDFERFKRDTMRLCTQGPHPALSCLDALDRRRTPATLPRLLPR